MSQPCLRPWSIVIGIVAGLQGLSRQADLFHPFVTFCRLNQQEQALEVGAQKSPKCPVGSWEQRGPPLGVRDPLRWSTYSVAHAV